MSPRTLPDDILLLDGRTHIGFTHRRLRAHALTLALAPKFESLLSDWTSVHEKEIELDDAIDDALVVVHAADQELNVFAQRVSAEVVKITGNSRTHKLYLHYFEGNPLHLFTRPILGAQLAAMHPWVNSLSQSEHPSLQALAAELPALLEKADAAATAKTAAEQAKRQFREVGERKKLIDDVNAARKETYGVLATLPHKHPGLPSRFADMFFRRDRVKQQDEPTLETVQATLDALRQETAEQEKLLAQLQKEQAEAMLEEAQQAKLAMAEELAALQQEIEQKAQKAAALQAALQPVQ